MEYCILGKKIQFSEEQMNCFKVKHVFNEIANEARRKVRLAHSECKNYDDFVDKVWCVYYDHIYMSVSEFMKKEKIYSVTNDMLLDQAKQFYDETIYSVIREYNAEVSAVTVKRDLKKIGFLEANSKLSEIYNDKEHFEKLQNAIAEMCDLLQEYCIYYIADETGKGFEDISEKEERVVDAIIDNLTLDRVQMGDRKECYQKIFRLNPCKKSIYSWAISDYGDKDKEIERLGTDIGFNISEIKQECMDDIYKDKNFKSLTFSASQEQELLDLIQQVKEKCEWIGMETCNQLDILEQKWTSLDEEIRTLEGTVYDTREKVQQVKQDIAIFEEYISKQDYDKIDILDETIYNQCIEDIYNLSYNTEEFRNKVKERAKLYLRRFVNHHETLNRLSNPATFLTEFNNLILQTSFYHSNSKKLHFNDYSNDKKNSAPIMNTYKGIPILYQENPKLLERNRGIVYTTQEMVVYDKKNLSIIPIGDIYTVQFDSEGKFQVVTKKGTLDFEALAGIDSKELKAEYVSIIDSIIYVLKRMIKENPQIVNTAANTAENPQQSIIQTNQGTQQAVYSQYAHNTISTGTAAQPKKKKSILSKILIAVTVVALLLVVFNVALVGFVEIMSEDSGESTAKSAMTVKSEVADIPSEETPLVEDVPAKEETSAAEETVVENDYRYLDEFTYLVNVYEGVPDLSSSEECEVYYRERYDSWIRGEAYSYIVLDGSGILRLEPENYNSQIEFTGTWWDMNSQRCNMKINQLEENYYEITINWASGASENCSWYYNGEYDESGRQLICSGGVKQNVYYSESGEEIYDDPEYLEGGYFWVDLDGVLYWNDTSENAGAECYFIKDGVGY